MRVTGLLGLIVLVASSGAAASSASSRDSFSQGSGLRVEVSDEVLQPRQSYLSGNSIYSTDTYATSMDEDGDDAPAESPLSLILPHYTRESVYYRPGTAAAADDDNDAPQDSDDDDGSSILDLHNMDDGIRSTPLASRTTVPSQGAGGADPRSLAQLRTPELPAYASLMALGSRGARPSGQPRTPERQRDGENANSSSPPVYEPPRCVAPRVHFGLRMPTTPPHFRRSRSEGDWASPIMMSAGSSAGGSAPVPARESSESGRSGSFSSILSSPSIGRGRLVRFMLGRRRESTLERPDAAQAEGPDGGDSTSNNGASPAGPSSPSVRSLLARTFSWNNRPRPSPYPSPADPSETSGAGADDDERMEMLTAVAADESMHSPARAVGAENRARREVPMFIRALPRQSVFDPFKGRRFFPESDEEDEE